MVVALRHLLYNLRLRSISLRQFSGDLGGIGWRFLSYINWLVWVVRIISSLRVTRHVLILLIRRDIVGLLGVGLLGVGLLRIVGTLRIIIRLHIYKQWQLN